MAFIVEMVWGRPPALVVYDMNEGGELVPKKVIPTGDPPDPEWRHFSCHGQVWKDLLGLARRYGWQPNGTVPAEGSHDHWEKLGKFDDGYEPSDWLYLKQITEHDASAFADALERALQVGNLAGNEKGTNRPTLIVEGMTTEALVAANRGISEAFLNEFVSFLRKGPFNFAWDD